MSSAPIACERAVDWRDDADEEASATVTPCPYSSSSKAVPCERALPPLLRCADVAARADIDAILPPEDRRPLISPDVDDDDDAAACVTDGSQLLDREWFLLMGWWNDGARLCVGLGLRLVALLAAREGCVDAEADSFTADMTDPDRSRSRSAAQRSLRTERGEEAPEAVAELDCNNSPEPWGSEEERSSGGCPPPPPPSSAGTAEAARMCLRCCG
jgi:hypothetical protein